MAANGASGVRIGTGLPPKFDSACEGMVSFWRARAMKCCIWFFSAICVCFPLLTFAAEADGLISGFSRGGDLSGIKTLDLETAKRIAVLDNPTMAAAQARVEQAGQRVRQAEAAYLPRVDVSGSASHVGLSDRDQKTQLQLARIFDPRASIDMTEDRYTAGLTASWTLFDGFARKFTREAERLGQMQLEEARNEAQRLLLTSVSTTYYNAQLAMENRTIALADEAFNQRQVRDAEVRLQVGTGALSDVLNFKVQVNAARSRLNQSFLEYRRLLIGLAALMGVPDAGLPEGLSLSPLAPEMDTEMGVPDTDALIAEALTHRPDLQQSNFSIQQAESRIQLARSEFFPKLNLFADLNGNRTNNILFDDEDFGYALGINMSYALYSGDARKARLHEAVWGRAEAQKVNANLSITVAAEVRQAVEEINRARTELKLQRANTVLVEQNRDLVEKEYAAGQGTLVRLNEAQRDLVTAQSRLASALVSLRQAWQILESATGRIIVRFDQTK
jgi:outer membrane protein